MESSVLPTSYDKRPLTWETVTLIGVGSFTSNLATPAARPEYPVSSAPAVCEWGESCFRLLATGEQGAVD
jgi:hypothetical protein